MMEPETIRTRCQRELCVSQHGDYAYLAVRASDTEAHINSSLTVDECKALESALADARTDISTAPAPEQPQEEAATSPDDFGEKCEEMACTNTTIDCEGGFAVRCQVHSGRMHLGLGDSGITRWQKLNPEEATQLCDALSAFVAGGKAEDVAEPADETKPTAEVIAVHGELKIVVIDGVGFLVLGGATTMHGDPAPGLNRAAAQAYLLAWGHDPADAQAATQKIDA